MVRMALNLRIVLMPIHVVLVANADQMRGGRWTAKSYWDVGRLPARRKLGIVPHGVV
jgi:hypothetical protein